LSGRFAFVNIDRITKGIRQPVEAYYYIKSLALGYYYRIRYAKSRVTIGRHFRVVGRLSIRGPGSVRIGNNVLIDGTSHSVTPWTYSKDAKIEIGDNVFLNGTRFGCKTGIEIGNNCIVADCRILDVDHHSIIPSKRNDAEAIKTSPIRIGNNVWIALDSLILKGVSIGYNSTIAPKSVVINDVPCNCIYGGNPAKLIRHLTEDEINPKC
jgi:acetyltransferase-like isoleucine patch superfamily enzyme